MYRNQVGWEVSMIVVAGTCFSFAVGVDIHNCCYFIVGKGWHKWWLLIRFLVDAQAPEGWGNNYQLVGLCDEKRKFFQRHWQLYMGNFDHGIEAISCTISQIESRMMSLFNLMRIKERVLICLFCIQNKNRKTYQRQETTGQICYGTYQWRFLTKAPIAPSLFRPACDSAPGMPVSLLHILQFAQSPCLSPCWL